VHTAAFVEALLSRSIVHLIECDATLRTSDDPETIHEARVAVRRLRSELRTFAPVLVPEWANALREKLRWLSDELSRARDADVLLERLRNDIANLSETDRNHAEDTLEPFVRERIEAYARIHTMLQDRRCAALLSELREHVIPSQNAHSTLFERIASDGEKPAKVLARPLLAEAWKKLRKRVRRGGDNPSDAELHRIRIEAKHVRYALEACSPILSRSARILAKKLEKLQNVLGEEHDAVRTCERLQQAALVPESHKVVHELIALETTAAETARSTARKAWRKVNNAAELKSSH